MGTMNQFEEQLRPFKLALIEAFGLDPEKTGSNISAGSHEVTFRVIASSSEEREALRKGPLAAASLQYEAGEFPSAKFPADVWTKEQAQAVEAYLDQFPSFEDLPREMWKSLRKEFRTDRL